jgi:menaquinone-dependent protoporphyrinogen oxidase
MSNVLIVNASTHGHTGKIAARIDRVLSQAGHHCELHSVATATDLTITDYDLVIVGASIHAGHHQKDLVEWAKRHATTLSLVASAFFSVCLSAAEDTEESRQVTRDYLDGFEERTGWTPRRRTTFAGALQYREYDFMTRLAIRLMMHRGGHPTDTSQDYDYTDWDAVETFALGCAAIAAPAAAAR